VLHRVKQEKEEEGNRDVLCPQVALCEDRKSDMTDRLKARLREVGGGAQTQTQVQAQSQKEEVQEEGVARTAGIGELSCRAGAGGGGGSGSSGLAQRHASGQVLRHVKQVKQELLEELEDKGELCQQAVLGEARKTDAAGRLTARLLREAGADEHKSTVLVDGAGAGAAGAVPASTGSGAGGATGAV
jgi:hypothetical protein